MKYDIDDDRDNLLTVGEYAKKFASLVGWTFGYHRDRSPPSLRDHLYDPVAHLILVPWDKSTHISPAPAMRATHCDVLTYRLGNTKAGRLTAYFMLERVIGEEVHCNENMRLWIGTNNKLYLVPDPDGGNLCGACFLLAKQGILPDQVPWSDSLDYALGYVDANMLLFCHT